MFLVLCSFTIVLAVVLLVVQLNLKGNATAPFESVICTEQTCSAEPVKLSCIHTKMALVSGCDIHE